jgi:hypothetical protein
MKERPILFRDRLVRAILEDRKTQTRRLVKPQPPPVYTDAPRLMPVSTEASWSAPGQPSWPGEPKFWLNCPYGGPGDRLYVREAARLNTLSGSEPHNEEQVTVEYRATTAGYGRPVGHHPEFLPTATFRRPWNAQGVKPLTFERWTPGIHLPRWASRIILEVRDVRVERLQAISEADARAEGVEPLSPTDYDGIVRQSATGEGFHGAEGMAFTTARLAFASLWDSINGDRPGAAWNANPWVWAITFRRLP